MIFQVLLATSQNLEAELDIVEIEADCKSEAIKIAQSKYPELFITDCVKKRSPHGGKREGSGQPSKYGERTRVVRLPESLADQRDLIVAIPELRELLDDLEKDCADNPNSARRYFLKQALGEIRSLGF